MTRTKLALTMTTLGLTGLLTVSGCGAAAAAPDLAAETYALTTVGLDDGPTPAPSTSASAAAGKPRAKHPAGRAYLRKNTLHGEIAVRGKQGTRTIVVQRGTVTATDAKTLSVRSTDGFALTWTRAANVRVRGELRTGAEVGVAGRRDGDRTAARLIVVK